MVLSRFRTLALARLASAIVAVALSGAPALAAELRTKAASARPACRCPSHRGDHACGCHGRSGAQAGAPARPCHGASREAPLPASCDRIGGCGSSDGALTLPSPADPFTLPEAGLPAAPGREHDVTATPAAPRALARGPELPPPRSISPRA